MSHRRLFTLAAVFGVIIIVGFVLSVPHTREVPTESSLEAVQIAIPHVVLHDSFKKGTHTLSGTVTVPDACATVSAEASLTGDASSSQSILLALTLPPDTGTCLQIPTSVSFMTTIEAPSDASISVTVNGSEASTSPS